MTALVRAPDVSPALVIEEPSPGVVTLTLNRPERLNALTVQLVDDLTGALAWLKVRTDKRIVVLSGAESSFCAGLDLVEYGERGDGTSPQDRLALQQRIAHLVTALRALPQIVVAKIDGPAAGGGLALSLGADVRFASTRASFSVAFVRVGLSGADIGVSWLLPRLIGASTAFELMLTGRRVGAEEAGRLKLVSDVVAPSALSMRVNGFVEEVLGNSPMGVRMTKEVMWSQLEIGSLGAGIDLENRTQIVTTFTADHSEAVAAFLEKRPPRFADR